MAGPGDLFKASAGAPTRNYPGMPTVTADGSRTLDRVPVRVVLEPDDNPVTLAMEDITPERAALAARMASGHQVGSKEFAAASMRGLAQMVHARGEERSSNPSSQRVQEPLAAPAESPPMVDVVLELPSGCRVEASYHEVLYQDDYLVLVWDHSRGGALCRPPRPAPAAEETLAMAVAAHQDRPATVYLCVPTGCAFRYRNCEFLLFVVAEARQLSQ